MALPYEVKYSVQDGEGNQSTGTFYINSAQSAANAITEAQGMLQDIADLCLGQIVQATINTPIDITALTSNGAPDANSNVRYKFRMVMSSAEGHETILSIPAADIAEVVPSTNQVDQGVGTPGLALAEGVITRPITTSHNEDVTVVNKFYEVFGR